MGDSRRLAGLNFLKDLGLPTPNWREVRATEDICALQLDGTPHGWTIRTCRTDRARETGGFYLNYAPPDVVVKVLTEKIRAFAPNEFYVVYPSWQFLFSCNVVKDEDCYIVEGKFGSQKGLSAGKDGPDFSFQFPNARLAGARIYVGHIDSTLYRWLPRILRFCRRIPLDEFYVEVAVTDNFHIVFYELFEFVRR